MSQTNQKSLSALVGALIAAVVAAITTHRTDTEALAKQKAESDAKIQELQDRIAELDATNDDAEEVEALRGQIEEALIQAQAAKPPTDEHIAEVEKIEPADIGDASDTGGAAPAEATNGGGE